MRTVSDLPPLSPAMPARMHPPAVESTQTASTPPLRMKRGNPFLAFCFNVSRVYVPRDLEVSINSSPEAVQDREGLKIHFTRWHSPISIDDDQQLQQQQHPGLCRQRTYKQNPRASPLEEKKQQNRISLVRRIRHHRWIFRFDPRG